MPTFYSFATSLLCQNKLTARHQRALEHLDSELKAESERQKEQLHKELQRELEKTLLVLRKSFSSILVRFSKVRFTGTKETVSWSASVCH